MKVRHDEQEKSFLLETGHGVARVGYAREVDGTLDLLHTEVPAAARDQGIGGRLVEGALEHARTLGVRVRPSCPFVRAWLDDHPDYHDLVAG